MLDTSKHTGFYQIGDHFALCHSDGSKGHGRFQDCIGSSLGGYFFTISGCMRLRSFHNGGVIGRCASDLPMNSLSVDKVLFV